MRRAALALVLALAACTRPGDDRAADELTVGAGALRDATVEVAGGLAAIRELTDRRLELWSQSPVLDLALDLGPTAAGDWTIIARNILPDAVLATPVGPIARAPDDRPTVGRFQVTLPAGATALRIAPPDADAPEPFRIAAMADIQTALPEVGDVFAAINAVPDARFVVGMGDLTERGTLDEYDLYERQLETLRIPFYTTLGNHELWSDHMRFFERFGRASFQFAFKGVAFTFIDSGDAGVDPLVETWLDGWLANARDLPHVFLTHFPPLDPIGVRYGAFRSTRDAHRLLARLVEGRVDLTLYGHLHTYLAFSNAGIPARISGGGGAAPMKLDGIDRHFLMIELDARASSSAFPREAVAAIEVHRVD